MKRTLTSPSSPNTVNPERMREAVAGYERQLAALNENERIGAVLPSVAAEERAWLERMIGLCRRSVAVAHEIARLNPLGATHTRRIAG
jgi:hypothetical protein